MVAQNKKRYNQSGKKNFLTINFQLRILNHVIVSLTRKETTAILNVKLQAQRYTTTFHIFRIACQIADLNHPITVLPALTGLQEATVLEMGRILQSNNAYTDICHLIASAARMNLGKYIIETELKIGFTIDKSTTISKKRRLRYSEAHCQHTRTKVASLN
jgi:hypothetical protein